MSGLPSFDTVRKDDTIPKRGGEIVKSILKGKKGKKKKKNTRRIGWKHSDVRFFEATSPASHHRGMIFSFDDDNEQQNNESQQHQNNAMGEAEAFSIPPRRPRRKSWEEVPLPPRDDVDEDEDDDNFDDDDVKRG